MRRSILWGIYYGMLVGALGSAILIAATTIVFAEAEHSISGSMVRMQDTVQSGAVAQLVFENRAVNSDRDDSTFSLDLHGVGVRITFKWNTNPAGDDEVMIETDATHVAVPRSLVVVEGKTATAQIYPLEQVGF